VARAGKANVKSDTVRPVRIGLLGMYTRHNLGDTAIVRSMMTQIRARAADCEFIGISRTPAEAVAVHGIAALHSSGYGTALLADGSTWQAVQRPAPAWLPLGVGTRRIVSVARMLDLLVMTGGGQLEDFFGGTNSQPRALLTWTLFARLFRVPTALFAVGVDNLNRRVSQVLCAQAVRLAQMRSFREAGSVDLLRAAGLRSECRVVPDPALGLDTRRFTSERWRHENLVVVSPISFRTWTEIREASYDAYLKHLVAACERWAAEGRRLRFLCSDISMDPPVARQLIASLSPAAQAQAEFVDVDTVEGFLEHIAPARFVVASRLHAVIFSVAMGTPVIAISPARKVTRCMGDAGLSGYCLEMTDLTLERLLDSSGRLLAEQDSLRRQLAELTAGYRLELARAYDDLVRLLPSRRFAGN
jgi:polysaccharide pyruvyl transferase WcaK-like protein